MGKIIFLVYALAAAANAFADPSHLVNLKAKDFTINFPCEPQTSSTKTSNGSDFDQYICKTKDFMLQVQDTTLSATAIKYMADNPADVFTEMKKDTQETAKNKNMIMDPEKKMKIASFDAMELHIHSKTLEGRTIVIKKAGGFVVLLGTAMLGHLPNEAMDSIKPVK